MFAKNTKKEQIKEQVDDVVYRMMTTMEHTFKTLEETNGVSFRGLSIYPAKTGTGFLGILRLSIDTAKNPSGELDGIEDGDYIVFSHGDSFWASLAHLEVQLCRGEANLVPDKAIQNTAQDAQKGPSKRRKL